MNCQICGKGPAGGVTVYRANELGVKGIWRCKDHPCVESFTNSADPEINFIEQAINPTKEIIQ